MSKIHVWNQEVLTEFLSDESIEYLKSLPGEVPDIQWVWQELDRIWDHYLLDNSKPFTYQPISKFYSHPVWLMNGFYTQLDPLSNNQRVAIAKYLNEKNSKFIADFGGGFGELAISISNLNNNTKINIIEPFPSQFGLARIENYSNITVVKELDAQKYDVIIAQDVLEHVEDPVLVAYEIALSLEDSGKAIFANCFYPVIKCHLPAHFHLRHTFPWVMRAMGLRFVENIKGAEYAQVFEINGKLNLKRARRVEKLSHFLYPFLKNSRNQLSKLKQGILKVESSSR